MFRTVIVPLSGTASAEAAVPYAAEQATRDGATLVLVRVISRPELAPDLPRRGGPVPRAPDCPADEVAAEKLQAFAYLDGVARRFCLPAGSEAVVTIGDPILRLIAEIQRRHAPLVVIAAPAVANSKDLTLGEMARDLLLAGVAPVLAVRERASDASGGVGPPLAGSHGSTMQLRAVRTVSPAARMAVGMRLPAAFPLRGRPTETAAPAIGNGDAHLELGGV